MPIDQHAAGEAVRAHLDATAQAFGYDSILSAVSYADDSESPEFAQQGRMLRRWRSAVWTRCYALLAEGADGTIEDLIAALPKPQIDAAAPPPPDVDLPPLPDEATLVAGPEPAGA